MEGDGLRGGEEAAAGPWAGLRAGSHLSRSISSVPSREVVDPLSHLARKSCLSELVALGRLSVHQPAGQGAHLRREAALLISGSVSP